MSDSFPMSARSCPSCGMHNPPEYDFTKDWFVRFVCACGSTIQDSTKWSRGQYEKTTGNKVTSSSDEARFVPVIIQYGV